VSPLLLTLEPGLIDFLWQLPLFNLDLNLIEDLPAPWDVIADGLAEELKINTWVYKWA